MSKDSAVEEWWSVEFEEMVPIDEARFRSDVSALEYVDNLRRLDDPKFKPVALVKNVATTKVVSTTYPLGPDSTMVLAKVKAKLLTEKGVPMDGVSALDWAVRATIEAMNE